MLSGLEKVHISSLTLLKCVGEGESKRMINLDTLWNEMPLLSM